MVNATINDEGVALTKNDATTLITLQKFNTAPRVIVSSTFDVSGVLEALLYIRMGRQTESAFTASVNFRIEAGIDIGSNTLWQTITQISSALGSSVASQALSADAAAGQTILSMADTTGFAAGDIVFVDDATFGNSEFGRVAAVTTNESLTLESNLLYAHAATTTTVYNQAEMPPPIQIDCLVINKLRVVIDGAGAAQNFAAVVYARTGK